MAKGPTNQGAGSEPSRHSVWGRVVAPGGDPVSSAEVFWVAGEHVGKETVGLFDVHKVAQADVYGKFWAPSLPAGQCLLVPDFQRLGVAGDQVQIAHGTPLTLPLAADADEVELRFPYERTEFGSVHGVIRDPVDGRPASRLPVALLDESGTNKVRSGQTHTNGKFSFPFLREGTYVLAVWGTRHHLEGSTPVALARNARVDFKIEQHRRPSGPRRTLRVGVEDALGLPLRGAQVGLQCPSLHVAPMMVDRDGYALFEGLPALPTAVFAVAPGYWQAGATVAPTDDDPAHLTIALERSVRLRLAIRDADTGRPLRHANVLVTHPGGDYWVWGGVLPPPDAPPRDFHDVAIRPGRITVRAESPDYHGVEVTADVVQDDEHAPRLDIGLRPRGAPATDGADEADEADGAKPDDEDG